MSYAYAPKAGSLPDRLLAFLEANPDEELTRPDIAIKFDAPQANVDALLQLAVQRGCLQRKRNGKGELVWSLGAVKAVRDRGQVEGAGQATGTDDVLPVRQVVRPFPGPAAVVDIDPSAIKVRKGVRLQTPEEKLALRFDALFASFDVGDSAEFDADWEVGLREQLRRWGRGKKVRFEFIATEAGKVGMERRK